MNLPPADRHQPSRYKRIDVATGAVLALFAAGVALPLILYATHLGPAPSLEPKSIDPLLQAGTHVVVDIGVGPSLAAHLPNAVKWPKAAILQLRRSDDAPPTLKGRKLLLVCSGGIDSPKAALHLRALGVEAWSVRGGAQQYVSAVPGCSRAVLLRGDPAEDARIPAFRPSPAHEQWALVLAFFGIKALYSLMALLIVVMLWRQREADLAAIRWSMIWFSAGEVFCLLNVMVFFEDSLLLEHLHSLGMVLSFSCACYAMFEGLDARLVHFSGSSRCAATPFCRVCDSRSNARCGLRKLFLLLIPATALLAAIPLLSEFRDATYNTRVLGVLHSYRHPLLHQVYELRYLPAAAVVLLTACFLALWVEKGRSVALPKLLFSAALGAMAFSLGRLFLVASFADHQVWFAAWEETVELLFVGMAGAVLLIFARGLLYQPSPVASEVTS